LWLTIHHSIGSSIFYGTTVILATFTAMATLTDECLILITWVPQLVYVVLFISMYHGRMVYHHLYHSMMERAAEKARRSQFHCFSALPFELRSGS